jgi:transcriptional regulator with XRE-family HTH domain
MSRSARRTRKSVHSEEHRLLRDLLIAARKKAHLTQQGLADRLGRPQSFVAKYEGADRRVDVVEFIDIARALGTDPLRLLRGLLQKIG